MKVTDVDLTISAVRRSQYPTDNSPEFMLVGRSNVGKSSFINTLVNRKNMARISSRPGKTQTLNFYLVNNNFYLVDVPGYGYASVDKKTQEKFGKMIEEYLEKRDQLKRVFMLIDFRIKPTEDDQLMYNFLKYYNIPVTVIATKVDKVGGSKKASNKKSILSTLDLVMGDDLILFSSVTKLGREEVLNRLDELLSEGKVVRSNASQVAGSQSTASTSTQSSSKTVGSTQSTTKAQVSALASAPVQTTPRVATTTSKVQGPVQAVSKATPTSQGSSKAATVARTTTVKPATTVVSTTASVAQSAGTRVSKISSSVKSDLDDMDDDLI